MSRKPEIRKDQPAISFKVDVSRLPEKGITVRLDASPEELKALAAAHGLEKVTSFRAEFSLSRWKLDGVRIRGYVDAGIVQRCVVTLELLDVRVREDVDVKFVPGNAGLIRNSPGADHELQVDFEGEDAPEVLTGNKIDVGGIAEEFFELGIDPYPRKPGSEFAGNLDESGEGAAPASPFASLSALKLGQKPPKE